MRRKLLGIPVLVLLIVLATPEGWAQNKDNTFVLRGLFGFDSGTGKVVFLNPGGTHPPRLMIDQRSFYSLPTLKPELVIPTMDGYGIGIWKFYRIELVTGHLDDKVLSFKNETNELGDPFPVKNGIPPNDTRLAWIPRMTTVTPGPSGGDRVMDPDKFDNAEAAATFAVGRLAPIVDVDHEDQCFSIGGRKITAVADALEVKVKIKETIADKDKVLFQVQSEKDGAWVPFVMLSGTRIELFALPPTPAKEHLAHFHHYFDLVKGGATEEPVLICDSCNSSANCKKLAGGGAPAGPGTKPIRCAPVQFP